MRPEKRIALAKDLVLFFGGLSGIGYQQVTGQVNVVLLVIFTAMTGVPGLTSLINMWRGSGIELPSQREASPDSSSESDNSSPNLEGSGDSSR